MEVIGCLSLGLFGVERTRWRMGRPCSERLLSVLVLVTLRMMRTLIPVALISVFAEIWMDWPECRIW